MPSFACPSCGAALQSAQPVPAGKLVKCKKCDTTFAPTPAAGPRPGTAAPVAARAVAKAAPVAAKAAEPAAPAKPNRPDLMMDDDDSPFGVVKEEDTEEQIKAKKKVNFSGVVGDGKRSARGPAMALLVLPSNLLIAEGALTVIAGIVVLMVGIWPIVFTEIEANDEEITEQAVVMIFGVMLMAWGALVCVGASRMQNLESYNWGFVGAFLGIMPLLVGIFAIVMLRNPKVIAGFEEIEGATEDDKKKDDDDDDEEDDEDD